MNWKPGPARCRNDQIEAEILATDMNVSGSIAIRWKHKTGIGWNLAMMNSNGRYSRKSENAMDLLPPKLSRDEVASKCVTAFLQGYDDGGTTGSGVRAVIECYDQLRREGLCDE